MFLDQKVIGWYRPNLVLDNKQLFLEVFSFLSQMFPISQLTRKIYKETTLLNRHSANVYASNVTFEFETRGEGNYNFCFQEMNNNGHISEAWDGPHYSLVHFAYQVDDSFGGFSDNQIINLHDHHQQQFHEFQEEQRKGDKLAIWAYKTGNLEYALEQVHVDMIKFNQHLRNSVSQLCWSSLLFAYLRLHSVH